VTGPVTIGIVIPAYNEEETIRACVTAALGQTVAANEIIVVDNRSTDQTASILQEMIQANPEADIIGRIDADTLLEPDWVEKVQQVFSDKKVDAATGPVIYYDMPLRRYMARADDTVRKAIFRLATSYKFLFGTNMALRREAWQAVRGEICLDADREMFEDIDLSVHLYDQGFKAVYSSDMVAGMSARRIDGTPKDFYDYVQRFDTTYRHHGIRKRRLRAPAWVYLALYPIGKGLRWSHQLSQRQPFKLPRIDLR
jgi:glycosyltransferase involved in cell wall biosynthesis